MTIDPQLLTKHFPGLAWRNAGDSACASVPSESRFLDLSITVLDYKDGTYSASLYLNDELQVSNWIEDESLEGVLKSLKEIRTDIKNSLSSMLPQERNSDDSNP